MAWGILTAALAGIWPIGDLCGAVGLWMKQQS